MAVVRASREEAEVETFAVWLHIEDTAPMAKTGEEVRNTKQRTRICKGKAGCKAEQRAFAQGRHNVPHFV